MLSFILSNFLTKDNRKNTHHHSLERKAKVGLVTSCDFNLVWCSKMLLFVKITTKVKFVFEKRKVLFGDELLIIVIISRLSSIHSENKTSKFCYFHDDLKLNRLN